MYGSYNPLLEAEIEYRRNRIAHDYAAAHRWQLRGRRAARRMRGMVLPATSHRPSVRRAPAH